MNRRSVFTVLAGASLLALGACSGINTVAVDVSSQGNWSAASKTATYAIERLPSQQANPLEQGRVEAAAMPALAAGGFTPAPADQADLLIQVGARVFEVVRRDPFASSFYWRNDWWLYGHRRPFFYGPGYYGPGYYGPGFYGSGFYGQGYGYDSEFQREAAVLIRDRRSQKIVYETRAVYSNRWSSDQLLPALFEAAMKDFPQPALSPRTVVVTVPPA